MKSFLPEKFRSRVLLGNQTTANAAQAYLLPTAGVNAITVRSVVTMGNAADLAISLKYADDATGTNTTAWPDNVPVYVNGVKQADAKAHTITAATGSFIVDFLVDPAKVPEGKFVGVSYENSNAGNLMCASLVEETMYSNTAS